MSKVETFTKEQFEETLPNKDDVPLWSPLGLVQGEYAYEIRVKPDTNKRITIRSSVRENGISAGQGNDSIRCWVEYYYPAAKGWIALGKGDTTFRTHRTGDWRGRLTNKLRTLYQLGLDDGTSKVVPPLTAREEMEDKDGKEVQQLGSSSIASGRGNGLDPFQIGSDNQGQSVAKDTREISGFGDNKFSDATGTHLNGNDVTIDNESTVSDESEGQTNDSEPIQDICRATATETSLNQYQQAVVALLGKGAQVVEACPGSGKTKTLEHLVFTMIQSGIDPSRIGIFTFSNSAAAEARVRIAKMLWPDITPDELDFLSDPFENKDSVLPGWADGHPARKMLVSWTCTIHALSLRLLKRMGDKVRVLSGKEQWQADGIIEDSLKEMKWNEASRSIKLYISLAIRNLIEPGQSEAFFSQALAGTDVAFRARDLAEIFRRYYEFCKRRKLVDYDMMQSRVLWRLRNDPTWRKKAQEQFDYILVDEFQDTSDMQAEILWTLAARTGNIVMAADVDQAMYSFRGAVPEVVRSLASEAWPNVKRFNLPINYRSTQEIISSAETLIHSNYDGPDDPYLKPFQGRPNVPDGVPLSYTEHPDFDALCAEVAAAVAERPSDWFILNRTRAACAAIHTWLVRCGIPAVNKSGGLLFGAPHVRKVLAYARLACNYEDARDDKEILYEIANVATSAYQAPFTKRRHDENCSQRGRPAWKQTCSCVKVMEEKVTFVRARFWGRAGVDKCGGNWDGIIEQSRKYPKALATKATWDLVFFVRRLEELTGDARACLNMIISDCVGPWLEAEYGQGTDLSENGKMEDLTLLLSMVEPGQTIEEYLEAVDKLSLGGKGLSENDSVIIGTGHFSKGRERPRVIANVTRLPVTPPKNKAGKLPIGRPPMIEEERRLLYVMITRAKTECRLVGSREWAGKEMKRSRFVGELGLEAK